MYKRIMAAIDDSFATSEVLNVAVEMARLNGAKLAICHAVDESILAQHEASVILNKVASSVGQVSKNLKRDAAVFVDEAARIARGAGVDAEIKIVASGNGHVADMLAAAAAEWQADLLVVGAHGRSVEHFFVGSVAEKLASRAQTSLLLVRGA